MELGLELESQERGKNADTHCLLPAFVPSLHKTNRIVEGMKIETQSMLQQPTIGEVQNVPPPSYSEAISEAIDQNDANSEKGRIKHKAFFGRGWSSTTSRLRNSGLRLQNVLLFSLLLAAVVLIVLVAAFIVLWQMSPATGDSLEKRLLMAAETGDLAQVGTLLAKGASVNARLPEFHGRSALHLAAQHGHAELVHYLMVHGANATSRSSSIEWQSPLHLAANDACRPEIVRMLLDGGAKPEDRDASGKLAIDYAMSRLCYEALYERSERRKADEQNQRWILDMRARLDRYKQLEQEMAQNGGLFGPRGKEYTNRIFSVIRGKDENEKSIFPDA